MIKYRVAHSPLTGVIYAGRLASNNQTWTTKSDVTTEACVAVAQHVVNQHSGAMTLRAPDGSGWDIEATEIKSTKEKN